MSTNQRVVETGAMPQNIKEPYPAGAGSPFEAVIIKNNTANTNLNTLINGPNKGGKRRRQKHIRGGAGNNSYPVVVVPGTSSTDSTPAATNALNTQLTVLSNKVQAGAAYDDTVGKSQDSVVPIMNKNDQLYGIKGGTKRRKSYKKGGSWPVWSCLSGGKKSRKCKKCKSKRRKTCKHIKRHR